MKFKVDTNKGYWIWLIGFWVSTIIATFESRFPYWEFNIFWLGAHAGHWIKRHYRNRLDRENGEDTNDEEDI